MKITETKQQNQFEAATDSKPVSPPLSFTQTRGEPGDLTFRDHRGQLHGPVPAGGRDRVERRRWQPNAGAAHFIGLRSGRRHDGSDEHAAVPVGAVQWPVHQVHRAPPGFGETSDAASQQKQWGAPERCFCSDILCVKAPCRRTDSFVDKCESSAILVLGNYGFALMGSWIL